MNERKNFSAWWAIIFTILTFNLVPIPFVLVISLLGDWVYQNPVIVDMNYMGEIKMHPVADNLTTILSMSATKVSPAAPPITPAANLL